MNAAVFLPGRSGRLASGEAAASLPPVVSPLRAARHRCRLCCCAASVAVVPPRPLRCPSRRTDDRSPTARHDRRHCERRAAFAHTYTRSRVTAARARHAAAPHKASAPATAGGPSCQLSAGCHLPAEMTGRDGRDGAEGGRLRAGRGRRSRSGRWDQMKWARRHRVTK